MSVCNLCRIPLIIELTASIPPNAEVRPAEKLFALKGHIYESSCEVKHAGHACQAASHRRKLIYSLPGNDLAWQAADRFCRGHCQIMQGVRKHNT